MPSSRVSILLDIKGKLGPLDEASSKFRSLTASVVSAVGAIGPLFAAVQGLRQTIATSAEFEKSINRVGALSGATAKQLLALGDEARRLGETTTYSAGQAGDAMGFLAMAGFNTTQILGSMPSTLELAAAAQMDLAEAADITSNILTGYQKEVSELGQANDVLVATFTTSNTSLQQLGAAMKFVAPVAAANKIAFEETAAAIGLLGNAGIQGEMAGTSLRGAITRLSDPTSEAQRVMERLGLTAFDASGNFRSLTEIVGQLEASGANTADMMTIFGQRAGPAMQALVSQGTGALRDFTARLKDIETTGGTASRIAYQQTRGLAGAWVELTSAAEGLAISVGDSGLTGGLTRFVYGATAVIRSIAEVVRAGRTMEVLPLALEAAFESGLKAVQDLLSRAFGSEGGEIAIAVLGGVMRLSTRIASGMINGMSDVIAVVAALWTKYFETMRELALDTINWIVRLWIAGVNKYIDALNLVLPKSKELSQLTPPQFDVENARDFSAILADTRDGMAALAGGMTEQLQENLDGALVALGQSADATDTQVSATERLRDLLREITAENERQRQIRLEEALAEPVRGGAPSQVASEEWEEGTLTALDAVGAKFKVIEGGLRNGIQNALGGLITGTIAWGNALQGIATSILNSIVGAIAEMGADWVIEVGKMGLKWMSTQLGMFLFGQKLKAADSATTAAKGAADAAAMAPAAATASIASFGAAAAIGLAAVVAAMALFGGFREGGYTGGGGTNAVAGVVHGKEFVFPADVVARAGGPGAFYSLMDSIRSGGGVSSMTASAGTTAAQAGGAAMSSGSPKINVGIFDDRASMRRFFETNEGQRVILDTLRRNRHEFQA